LTCSCTSYHWNEVDLTWRKVGICVREVELAANVVVMVLK